MQVGIEDCLHIEFEFDRSRYHLKDVVVGKVFFVLVRIKIKDMQLDVIKVETAGVGKWGRVASQSDRFGIARLVASPSSRLLSCVKAPAVSPSPKLFLSSRLWMAPQYDVRHGIET